MFQYRIVVESDLNRAETFEEELNRLGRSGWRAIATFSGSADGPKEPAQQPSVLMEKEFEVAPNDDELYAR